MSTNCSFCWQVITPPIIAIKGTPSTTGENAQVNNICELCVEVSFLTLMEQRAKKTLVGNWDAKLEELKKDNERLRMMNAAVVEASDKIEARYKAQLEAIRKAFDGD